MQTSRRNPRPAPPAGSAALLAKAAEFYRKTLLRTRKGLNALRDLGLNHDDLIERCRIGYCNGKLSRVLPSGGQVLAALRSLGVLQDGRAGGSRERLLDCLVIPVLDAEGGLISLCGHHAGTGEQVLLPSCPTTLWNVQAAKLYSDLLVAPGVVDALSLLRAGFSNVLGLLDTEATDADIRLLEELGVRTLTIAGSQAKVEETQRHFPDLRTQPLPLPDRQSLNSVLRARGPDQLSELVENGLQAGTGKTATAESTPGSGAGFSVAFGCRRYEVRGLEKGPRKLKATVRVEHGGRLHVDTLDFYSARSRKGLCLDLGRLFDETAAVIEADVTRLVKLCEERQVTAADQASSPDPAAGMSARERTEAEAFGRSPDLFDQIVADYETCGLVGEQANKLLCYVAATSRKMDAPLSVLVMSSSGAGKTALQDATLMFCPPEDIVKLTSLTGKALFYKKRHSLKHKVLALEEGMGAEQASYAIRNLISARELIIETTVKDLGSGRLTTVENRVEGPTAIFMTTTDPDVDPETRSRFFVTSVDESRDQTRAILKLQRLRQTLEGQTETSDVEAVLRRHRNFQRLLRPLMVVNRYAGRLSYADDRLQSRRDQPKYLNLIKAVAFLRQMARPVKEGRGRPYVEVEVEDIRVANELASEILGRSLDELNGVSRALLMVLERMVAEKLAELRQSSQDNVPRRTDVHFTRRQIREYTGWAHSRCVRYLKQLVDLEYVAVDSGRNGSRFTYRLLYDGQGRDGARFLLGLKPVEELET